MKIFYMCLVITAIELVVITFNTLRIKNIIRGSNETGLLPKNTSKIDLFFIRMYANYKGMLLVLVVIILFLNLAVASVIHLLYNLISHII